MYRHDDHLAALLSQFVPSRKVAFLGGEQEGNTVSAVGRRIEPCAVDLVIFQGGQGNAAEEEGELAQGVGVVEPLVAEGHVVADRGALAAAKCFSVPENDGAIFVQDVPDGVVVLPELKDWELKDWALAEDLQICVAARVVGCVVGCGLRCVGQIEWISDVNAATPEGLGAHGIVVGAGKK